MINLNYFNFKEFNNEMLLTNDFGNFIFLNKAQFQSLLKKQVSPDTDLYQSLLHNHMLYEGSALRYSHDQSGELSAYKSHVFAPTCLHIFVVATACNLNCVYCQANNGIRKPSDLMTKEVAEKAVDMALQSPSEQLSFEFQGGEPLVNWNVIKHIVEYSEARKGEHCISYNLVSNLTLLTDEILDYMQEHQISISTSVDGFEKLHDMNRPFPNGEGSFQYVKKAIERIRARGIHVGAIQTTTRNSLTHAKEIIDAYLQLGFDSIFIRPLTPLGKAFQKWESIGYTPEEYVRFYREALEYIFEVNRKGFDFREEHAAIFMRKILGYSLNYMELRSPCGAGIGQLAYYTDGTVFTCDEGRMLYEMGNDAFQLGTVHDNVLSDLIKSSSCKATCAASVLESIPSCCDCVYQPYCGTCPVVNYALQGDIIEKRPRDYKCRIYSGMLDLLFGVLQSNRTEEKKFLEKWSN